jgi:hypothetical protein
VTQAALMCLAGPLRGAESTLLRRFLTADSPSLVQYRALRHLEARNQTFGVSGWMDAWTESDRSSGFRYEIVAEGGSGYVRRRVLRAALEGEREIWATHGAERAALTPDNYSFEEGGSVEPGVVRVAVKPKRKDVVLIEGSLFVHADDGDLVRAEGQLAKTPSFWTRRVDVTRRYDRISGVRVPVALESVASVLIAGRSTFRMTYEYQTVNGERVGNPQPRAPGPDSSSP